MTKDEALKLALEALEGADMIDCDMREAITAIKEALANVATNDTSQECVDKTSEIVHEAQRTWFGLTPQERDEINEQVYGAVQHHVAFHHAIEAALKAKNT